MPQSTTETGLFDPLDSVAGVKADVTLVMFTTHPVAPEGAFI